MEPCAEAGNVLRLSVGVVVAVVAVVFATAVASHIAEPAPHYSPAVPAFAHEPRLSAADPECRQYPVGLATVGLATVGLATVGLATAVAPAVAPRIAEPAIH